MLSKNCCKNKIAQVSFYLRKFILTFSQTTILDASKRKEFANGNFKFDEILRKFSEWVENAVGEKEKLLVMSNFSFSQSVFKRLVLQTRKNQGFFGKGLHSAKSL